MRFVTKLLNENEQAGIKRWFVADTHDDGKFQIVTEQDVTDVLDLCKEERNMTRSRTPFGKGFKHLVARVPLSILEPLKKTGQHPSQDQNAYHKWLDGDGKVWKSRDKKLGS